MVGQGVIYRLCLMTDFAASCHIFTVLVASHGVLNLKCSPIVVTPRAKSHISIDGIYIPFIRV